MKCVLALLAALAVIGLVAPGPAGADDAQGWHSEQPVAGNGLAQPLGEVGDIEFWSPNRGALITSGVGGMPAGVYVYDGVGWHLYSSVCGGHHGRIAWSGPDEFWTISDQPAGQETLGGNNSGIQTFNHSLCHFQNGKVVASYAEPLNTPTSYLPLNAAACAGPADCWFGGERLNGTVNTGAFHLVWDGSAVTAIPSLSEPQPSLDDPGRTVAEMTFAEGRLYESVTVGEEDGTVAEEPDPAQPSFIHLIEPTAVPPFRRLFPGTPLSYGGTQGSQLGPFRFAEGDEGLFAIAGAQGRSGLATVTMVAIEGEWLRQIPLGNNQAFEPGDLVNAAAAEPGGGRIWVGYQHALENTVPPSRTRIAAVRTDGTVEAPISLLSPGGGQKGSAGAIACPAPGQCWLATVEGWLYHLGGPLPRDEDPAMAGPIDFRPPDDSTPSVPPAELPEDNSGAELPQRSVQPPDIIEEPPPRRRPRKKKLVSPVKQKVLDGKVLQLSFKLFARASVRLVAKQGKKVVAATPKRTLAPGPHRLRLRLDPKRWPNHLSFQVHPAGKEKR